MTRDEAYAVKSEMRSEGWGAVVLIGGTLSVTDYYVQGWKRGTTRDAYFEIHDRDWRGRVALERLK